jgi:ACR3 family arsenite efflux pump ArsB
VSTLTTPKEAPAKSPQSTQKLARSIVKNVVPAYLVPTAILSLISRLIPNRVAGRSLAYAAFTTIAIPSALAALTITVYFSLHTKRGHKPPQHIVRSVLVAAIACGIFTLAASAALVGTGLAASRLFGDAIPSAVIGGAVAATHILRARTLATR